MRHRAPRRVRIRRPKPAGNRSSSAGGRGRARHAAEPDRRLVTGAVSSGLVLAAGVMVGATEIPSEHQGIGAGDATLDARLGVPRPSRTAERVPFGPVSKGGNRVPARPPAVPVAAVSPEAAQPGMVTTPIPPGDSTAGDTSLAAPVTPFVAPPPLPLSAGPTTSAQRAPVPDGPAQTAGSGVPTPAAPSPSPLQTSESPEPVPTDTTPPGSDPTPDETPTGTPTLEPEEPPTETPTPVGTAGSPVPTPTRTGDGVGADSATADPMGSPGSTDPTTASAAP
jgi:hypothetical protein